MEDLNILFPTTVETLIPQFATMDLYRPKTITVNNQLYSNYVTNPITQTNPIQILENVSFQPQEYLIQIIILKKYILKKEYMTNKSVYINLGTSRASRN